MTATIQVTTEISLTRVADLLCCAFEGNGRGFWCRIHKYKKPRKPIGHMTGSLAGKIFPHVDYPLCKDGAVLCYDAEDYVEADVEADPTKLLRLDLDAVRRGLTLMPRLAPRHYGNFLAENEDSTTGDVFVQLCLLGEVKYG